MKKQIFAGLFIILAAVLVSITFDTAGLMLAFPALVGVVSSVKLKEQRTALEADLLAIINTAKTEKREFTEDENTKRSSLIDQIEAISNSITLRSREEQIEARVAGQAGAAAHSEKEERDLRSYSIAKAMNMIATGRRLEGLEAEMDQEARKEFSASGIVPQGNLTIPAKVIISRNNVNEKEARTVLLGWSGGGAGFVQTDVTDFITALYDKNVMIELGAKTLSGLVGNLTIPSSGGSTAAWEGEVESNADGTPAISNLPVSPKRLGAYGLVSKSLLLQAGNYDVEKLIQEDLINAINGALQIAAIAGAGSGSDQPTGILNTVGIGDVIGGDNGAYPLADHLVELEEKIATAKADIGTMGFLTNPKVRARLKKTALDAGSGLMLWDWKVNNELMGYKAGVTTAVASNLEKGEGTNLSSLIFGNFADMMMLQWGGFDIVLNPYTNAKTNQLEIVINSFWDVLIRRAASFAAMKDVKTL